MTLQVEHKFCTVIVSVVRPFYPFYPFYLLLTNGNRKEAFCKFYGIILGETKRTRVNKIERNTQSDDKADFNHLGKFTNQNNKQAKKSTICGGFRFTKKL